MIVVKRPGCAARVAENHPAMTCCALFILNMIVLHHKVNTLRRISGNEPLISVLMINEVVSRETLTS